MAKKVDLDARYKMPPDARARLGAMIRDLRVANKLTQSGLGGIEADAAAISRIERARQGITLDTLWTIAMRLRVPVFTLVAYSEGQISSRQMRIIQAYEGADDEHRAVIDTAVRAAETSSSQQTAAGHVVDISTGSQHKRRTSA